MKAVPITKIEFIKGDVRASFKLLSGKINSSLIKHSNEGLVCFKIKIIEDEIFYTVVLLFTNNAYFGI